MWSIIGIVMISLFSWQGQNQVWPKTEFSSVCFSQSRIGVKKCIFNQHTIKVCVSCWRCQGSIKNNWRKPWLCVCWKLTFLHQSLIVKSQQNRIKVVTWPGPGGDVLRVVQGRWGRWRCCPWHRGSGRNRARGGGCGRHQPDPWVRELRPSFRILQQEALLSLYLLRASE